MRKGTFLAGVLGVCAAAALGFAEFLPAPEQKMDIEVSVGPSLLDIIKEARLEAVALRQAREDYLRAHPEFWTCEDFLRFAPEQDASWLTAVLGAPVFCPDNYEDPSDAHSSVVSDDELCEVSSSSHHIELSPGDWCHIEVTSPNFDLDAADDDDASVCVHNFSGMVTVGYTDGIDISTLDHFADISEEHYSLTRLDDLCRALIEDAEVMLTDRTPLCPDGDLYSPLDPCKFPFIEVCDDGRLDCSNDFVDDDCEAEVVNEVELDYQEEIEEIREYCHDLCFPILGDDICLAICGVGANDLVNCYRDCDEFEETEEALGECEVECETYIPEEDREFILE